MCEITDEEIIRLRKKTLDDLGLNNESKNYSEACEVLDSFEESASDLVHFSYLHSSITAEQAFEMITNHLRSFLGLKIKKPVKKITDRVDDCLSKKE